MPRLGYKQSPDHISKRIASIRGKVRSPETLQRMSVAARKHGISLETRSKMASTMRGKPKTKEHAANISAGKRKQLPVELEVRVGSLRRKTWGWLNLGLTPVEILRHMDALNRGTCEVCGNSEIGGKRLSLDHDHKTGRYRGTLCNACNRAIGLIRDSSQTAQRIAYYLGGR